MGGEIMLSKKTRNRVNNKPKGILIVVVLILVLLTSITYAENIGFPDVKQEWMKVPVRWGGYKQNSSRV